MLKTFNNLLFIDIKVFNMIYKKLKTISQNVVLTKNTLPWHYLLTHVCVKSLWFHRCFKYKMLKTLNIPVFIDIKVFNMISKKLKTVSRNVVLIKNALLLLALTSLTIPWKHGSITLIDISN